MAELSRGAQTAGEGEEMSRLCGRESSALLVAGAVTVFGDQQPEFSRDDRLVVTRTAGRPLSALQREQVKQMCVGNSHLVFLTEKNEVFVTGSNQFGQLGVSPAEVPHQDEIVQLDTSFLQGARIKQVDTGIAGGTGILTESGTVWTAGELCGRAPCSAPEGGSPPRSLFGAIPSESFDGEAVEFMSQGGVVSFYITTSGAVFVTGRNSCAEGSGMLGQGDHAEVPQYSMTPIKIESLQQQGVRAVSGCAGRMWALVVDGQGRLFGWGSNREGQLGLGETVRDQCYPVEIPVGENEYVVKVSCSWSHSLALTKSGNIFSFGNNSYGQLGRRTVDDVGADSGTGGQVAMTGVSSHACPGLMDLSSIYSLSENERCSLVVTSVHAGGWHSLIALEKQMINDDDSESQKMYASCGIARHGALGSWDNLEEVSFGQNNIINLCRKIPVVIDMKNGGIGANNFGSVVYVPAIAPLKKETA